MNFYRCTVPHWQGNDFVAAGAVLPEGHSQLIPEFFTVIEWDEIEAGPPPEPTPEVDIDSLRAYAEELGVKVDKRWGVDRLNEEIEAAEAAEDAEAEE